MHSRDWDAKLHQETSFVVSLWICPLLFGIEDTVKKIVVDHVRKVRVLFMGMWNHLKRHEMWRRGDFLGNFQWKVLTCVNWLFGDPETHWNCWNQLCRLWGQKIQRRRVTGVWHPCTLIFQCGSYPPIFWCLILRMLKQHDRAYM